MIIMLDHSNSPSTCVALTSSSVAMLVVTLKSLALKVLTLSLPRALSTLLLQQLGPGGHTERRGSEQRRELIRRFAKSYLIIMIEGQLKDRERRSSEFMTLMDGVCLWRGEGAQAQRHRGWRI